MSKDQKKIDKSEELDESSDSIESSEDETMEETEQDETVNKVESDEESDEESESEEKPQESLGPLGKLPKKEADNESKYGAKSEGPLGPLGKLPDKEEDEHAEETTETDKTKPSDEKQVSDTHLFALRTTANREDQVMDFLSSNIVKKKLNVYSVIRPHGMRGYIFIEAAQRIDAEQAGFNIPYARGILKNEINYSEIEHMLEQVKKDANIKKNDIAEIISGPFKREKCKITRIDKAKEEVVVELLEAAVPIPITLRVDALKVIRRETDDVQEE
ncbi:MAG: transcription elongation factor Spt5 [Candidatus Woesearchaeota archaeon]